MVAYCVVPVSSLEKILPGDDARLLTPICDVTGLAGETVSFQLAYRVEHDRRCDADFGLADARCDDRSGADDRMPSIASSTKATSMCVNEFVARVSLRGMFAEYAHVRVVRDVPVDFPCYPGHTDDMYLSEQPGLYPDLLQDTNGWVSFMPDQWRSLWIDIDLPITDHNSDGGIDDAKTSSTIADRGELTISFATEDGTIVQESSVMITRIPTSLPALTIAHTEWFHADCLAQYYGVPVWSEEHWRIVERFVALAAKRGVTMIYTPLFTPPLDTQIGGERPTMQLVGVTQTDDDSWSFDFTRLERWVAMCKRAGIHRFEMSHLFTQWGADHCPKIVATVDGVERKVFGWNTSATGDGYPEFLAEFLPALDRELQRLGIADRTVFHVSDEPTEANLNSYLAAKAVVAPYLADYPIMDALSHVEFYNSGACEHPIPADNAIEPFVAAGVKDLWTYYCCAQTTDVPNRFIAMPSYRNRILGFLLYVYDLAGFLHWGFNFYNTERSRRAMNPYTETGTPEGFAAGDAFLVYPGSGGKPEESIRIMVLEEALNDLRACRLLEALTDRDHVVSILSEGCKEPLMFAHYPHSAAWLLDRRDAINTAIAEHIKQF